MTNTTGMVVLSYLAATMDHSIVEELVIEIVKTTCMMQAIPVTCDTPSCNSFLVTYTSTGWFSCHVRSIRVIIFVREKLFTVHCSKARLKGIVQ